MIYRLLLNFTEFAEVGLFNFYSMATAFTVMYMTITFA